MTATLKPEAEEETYSMDCVDLYEELESIERRVMVWSFHIQQDRLETDGGAYQLGEKLEGVGYVPIEEMTEETYMSEEGDEQQLGDETAELESATGWKNNSTEEENDMGDQDDLPTDKEELQLRRLHKENQPLEQLDRVIEEIKKLMLRSAKVVNKGRLNRRDPAIAAEKKQKKKQQQEQ